MMRARPDLPKGMPELPDGQFWRLGYMSLGGMFEYLVIEVRERRRWRLSKILFETAADPRLVENSEEKTILRVAYDYIQQNQPESDKNMTIAKTNDFTSDIILGEKYRDEQTGITGTATSIHFYQHACERVGIEFLKSDGELQEITFDAPRLTLVSTGVQATTKKTGGPARPGEGRSHGTGRGR